VARLRRAHSNIVGIKETTKDFEHYSQTFRRCGTDFLMWSGIELLCLPLLAIGGIGFVSAVANIAPKAVADMYDRWVEGDTKSAVDLHYALHPLVDLLFVETNPAPIKRVLERSGVIASGFVRPPLIPVTERGQRPIEELLVEGLPALDGPPAELARQLAGLGPA
jgi:4-hydroxy-tetrahydrodipicolinate synthase